MFYNISFRVLIMIPIRYSSTEKRLEQRPLIDLSKSCPAIATEFSVCSKEEKLALYPRKILSYPVSQKQRISWNEIINLESEM